MDQGRGDIGQDVRDILETRNAISEKLEILEHRFQETVQGTRTAVEEVVDRTKSTVEEMVDRVRDTADDFVDRTKQTFDPTYQVQQHPWAMVGGAILVGYAWRKAGVRRRHSSRHAAARRSSGGNCQSGHRRTGIIGVLSARTGTDGRD